MRQSRRRSGGLGVSCVGGCGGSLEKACLRDDIRLAGPGLHLRCDPDADPGRWYALYVRSRHEKVVESGLRGKGYSVFRRLPDETQESDRISVISVPLSRIRVLLL